MSPGNPAFSATGLNVREYYAGLAMQGILSNPNVIDAFRDLNDDLAHHKIASFSEKLADALIAKLCNQSKFRT